MSGLGIICRARVSGVRLSPSTSNPVHSTRTPMRTLGTIIIPPVTMQSRQETNRRVHVKRFLSELFFARSHFPFIRASRMPIQPSLFARTEIVTRDSEVTSAGVPCDASGENRTKLFPFTPASVYASHLLPSNNNQGGFIDMAIT